MTTGIGIAVFLVIGLCLGSYNSQRRWKIIKAGKIRHTDLCRCYPSESDFAQWHGHLFATRLQNILLLLAWPATVPLLLIAGVMIGMLQLGKLVDKVWMLKVKI